MSRRLRLSREADEDQIEIWCYTAEKFGIEQAQRYENLIGQAFHGNAEDPYRNGASLREDIAPGMFSYPIGLSAKRSGTNIHQAPHFVLYLVLSDSEICVSRVLHHSMDVAQHVPDAHKRGVIE